MSETRFDFFVYLWIAVGIVTLLFLIVRNIKAPYGRHSSSQWGPTMDNKWGWFWMEIPAVIVMPFLALSGPEEHSNYIWLLVVLWMIHYFNRVFVFPFRIRTKGKRIPVLIVISAFAFNLINGFFNGYYLGHYSTPDLDIIAPNVLIGLIVFATGMIINHQSDNILINLRKHSQGYQIPYGGLFRWVSCPNHFGEIIEWIGFAIVAWNLPALSFAIWTFSNLVPRTLNHHQWYKSNFEDYPKDRKAVFPGIL